MLRLCDLHCQAVFYVYEDFFSYKSGIYKQSNISQTPLGKHSVKIVGHGVDTGVSYWIAANSWGPAWGMDGFFKICASECMITSEMTYGQPLIN